MKRACDDAELPYSYEHFLLHPVLFIEHTPNPCIFRGDWTLALVPSFLYNFSFEQVLGPHGKYSSYFSLTLKLPALDRLWNIV